MHPSLFPSKFWSFIIISLFLIFSPNYALANSFLSCSDPFRCGDIQDIRYPFWGSDRPESCGYPGFKLICNGNVTEIEIMSARYQVLGIMSSAQMLLVARIDYSDGICPTHLIKSTFDTSPFRYNKQEIRNISVFYGCEDSESFTSIPQISNQLDCTINGTDMKTYYVTNESVIHDGSFESCSKSVIIQVPNSQVGSLEERRSSEALQEAVRAGIWLRWSADDSLCNNTCLSQRGQCGHNLTSGEFKCYFCPPGENCSIFLRPRGSNHKARNLGIGITIVAIVLVWFIVLWFKRKSLSDLLCHGKMDDNATIEAFIINFGSLGPKRYSYGEIKKITKKFSHKLGQGGYGSVYKGRLSDGRLVAVKVLSESKGIGEDFMNEVASISRTSHVNIVTLIGFCVERSKRALIYEFMPNGSLDKFIYRQGSDNRSRQLEWKILNNIVLGIARGLEYLHQGCNTRILHFDIKPHNILLDENFCPKISDFGLSKLCKMKESIVSMACARGTIAYIAPEVFCRNFGEVSYKSDVYSYGMLVLEMVGGRKNINVEVSQTSEIYFPTWIYKRLDQSMNLNLNGVTIEEEEEITRKLIIVSLWCIQSDPSNRPSMTKVLEMLQGSLQSLVIPPRPFVSSPLRLHETMTEELGSTS